MDCINQVRIRGYLGQDPKVFGKNPEAPILKVNVCTTRSYIDRKSGNKKEKSFWASLVFYEQFAKKAQALGLKKGDPIDVTGFMDTEEWKDGQGHAKKADVLVVQDFEKPTKVVYPTAAKSSVSAQSTPAPAQSAAPASEPAASPAATAAAAAPEAISVPAEVAHPAPATAPAAPATMDEDLDIPF